MPFFGDSSTGGSSADPSIIQSLQEQIDKNKEELKGKVDINAMPKKWAALLLIGQSNGQGYGEDRFELKGNTDTDHRIWQLGRYATGATTSDHIVQEEKFMYGDRFAELRPYDDCNLQLIPAVHCLDHVQNIYQFVDGGTASQWLQTAKEVLKFLPDDYGIILIPCCRGGSGFSSTQEGEYFSVKKSASEDSMKWGTGTPLLQDAKDRLAHVMDNYNVDMLLPIAWTQGEADAGESDAHREEFEAQFLDLRSFVIDNYVDKLPMSNPDNFRMICCSGTKWTFGRNTEMNYLDQVFLTTEANFMSRVSVYNNYAYLSGKYKNSYRSSQLVYLNMAVDEDGLFSQTNRESGTGETTSTREIHFSTKSCLETLPRFLANAIISYCPSFNKLPELHERQARGRRAIIKTDGVTYKSDAKIVPLDVSQALVHQDFTTATATNQAIYKAENVAVGVGAGGETIVNLSNDTFPKAMYFNGNQRISYDFSSFNASNTKFIVFKPDSEMQEYTSVGNLLSSGSSAHHKSGILMIIRGFLAYLPDFDVSDKCIYVAPAEVNLWNGDFGSWNSVCVSTDFENKIATMWINGVHAASVDTSDDLQLDILYLGRYGSANGYEGYIAKTVVMPKSLNDNEAYTLHHDMLGKFL